MPNVWEILQEVVSTTRHLSELRTEVQDVRGEIRQVRDALHAIDNRVVKLEAAQATTRETVRAEIAEAVADLRVRYAEAAARRGQLRPGQEQLP